MSIQAVAWVLEQTIPDPAAKLVLISLANAYNGKSGRCFPSIDQIAVESSCSRSTVKRKLQWLSEMGWISVHAVRDSTGRQMANSYSIRFGLEPNEEFTVNRGEGVSLNREGFTSEPGEGFNCEPPLKEPEEIPEEHIMSEPSSDDAAKSRKRISYPEPFEAFWQVYPRTPNMSKPKALAGWKRLTADEQKACHQAVPAYKAFLAAKRDHPTMHASTFINERRFEGFVEQAAPTAPKTVADDDWLKRLTFGRNSRQWHVENWGPFPGAGGCKVPEHLLQPSDGQGWAVWEA